MGSTAPDNRRRFVDGEEGEVAVGGRGVWSICEGVEPV